MRALPMRIAALVVVACACCESSEPPVTPEPETQFEVRIAERVIGANGHTKREVFVFGTKRDGSYATDEVVLSVDRAAAGSIAATKLQLGPLGARTTFTPCAASAPGCVGPAKLVMARAANPTTAVASVDLSLVPATRPSTAAFCAGRHTTLHLDGNDYVRNSVLHITEWAETNTLLDTPGRLLTIALTPTKITQGNFWSVHIQTPQPDVPISVGVYPNAARLGAMPGQPGLDVSGNTRGCNTITGAYEVHEVTITNGKLDAIVVSFEQHCEGDPATLLEGCVRYVKP
jgi:hypothetical protein